MYSIDPDIGNYVEYNLSQAYSRMNNPKEGENIDNADKIIQQFREDNGKRNESGEIVIASGLAYYEGEKSLHSL